MNEGGAGEAPLAAALEALRLDGAIFFRAEYSEPWSYVSPTGLEQVLRPGSRRLIYFHVVAAGRCWISTDDGERHWANEGDVIVLPYGSQHAVGGVDDAETVPITSLLDPPPWSSMPVLRYGGGGRRTDIVCGYLHSDDPLFDPALGAFPPILVVHPPAGPAAEFVQASVQWALATSGGYRPDQRISTRLPELLVIEVLRIHLADAPATAHGWLAALRDPVIGPALAELHAAPELDWSVAELASRVAVSRSLLDQRFRQLLGRPPIRYLTEWRMHLAANLLATTDLTVFQIARRVGYESEEAFSRAFKRSTDIPPTAWRLEHTASTSVERDDLPSTGDGTPDNHVGPGG